VKDMKRIFVSFFIILLLFNISWAQTQQKRSATITTLKGNVYVRKAGSEIFKPAVLNMALFAGDRVWVQANSYAVLTFADKSTLRLSANTQLDIVDLSKDEEKEISIFKIFIGKVWATVEKILKPGDRVEIQTPTAVAGVRGTSWVTNVLEDGTTYVNGLSGIVLLVAGGIEKTISEGFQVVVNPDGTFGEVKPFDVKKYKEELEKEIKEIKEEVKEKLGEEAKEVPSEEMEKIKPETKTQILKSEGGYGFENRNGEMFMKLAFTPELNLNILKLGLEVALLNNGKGTTLFELGFRYGEINLPSFGLRYGIVDNYNLGYGLIANRYSTNQLYSFLIRLEKPQKYGVNLLIPSPYKLTLSYDSTQGFQYQLLENPLTTYGIRLFYRPLSKLELGINAMADLDPTYTKQQLIVGADAGYFITRDIIAYMSFAQRVIHDGENLSNINVASENGFMGGIQAKFLGFINAELQLRSVSDNFTLGYFDSFYEKNKVKGELPPISQSKGRINGLLAGVNSRIMNIAELLILYEAYQDLLPSLHGEFALRIGPRINGLLIYEQKNIPLGQFNFINENTKLYAQAQYPIAQNVDVILKILRTFDPNGEPIDYYSVDTKIYF